MELRQLKTFQTVALLLNFHRAAESLNYAPSTISAQIRLLEEELKVPLFDRLGKRIQLTEAGRMLLRYSRRMLDMEREAVTEITGWQAPQGRLSIRIPQSIATYLMPSILSRFHTRYPKIGFDVGVCAYDSLVPELKAGLTDLAFLLADSIPFAELTSELLRVEPLVIVSSPDHPLSRKAMLTTGDLSGHPVFLPKHDCSYKMTFEQILSLESVTPPTFMVMNSIESIKQCVLKGIGIAMFPMMAIQAEVEQKRMVVLPWPAEGLETAILMIRHRDKWLSPIARAFMESVREVICPPVTDQQN